MVLFDRFQSALRLALTAVSLVLIGVPGSGALGQTSGDVAASTEGQAPAESGGR